MGRAPDGHDAVTHVFIDIPAMAFDDGIEFNPDFLDQIADRLKIQLLRQLGKPLDIGEQYRRQTAFLRVTVRL